MESHVTHSERVLRVLVEAEGAWVQDLYGKTRCMVHSRVADLRRKGYGIEQAKFGRGDHRYRLTAMP